MFALHRIVRELMKETIRNNFTWCRAAQWQCPLQVKCVCVICAKTSGLNRVNTPFCTPTWTPTLWLSLAPRAQRKTFNWIRSMSDFTEIFQAQRPVLAMQCCNHLSVRPPRTCVKECARTGPVDGDEFMFLLLTQYHLVDWLWHDMVRHKYVYSN